MKQKIIFILFIVLSIACNKNNTQEVIDVDMSVYKTRVVYLSEIADSVEYIPLETTDSCLLSGNITESIQLWGNYLLVITSHQYYLFNRQGKFLRQISSQGRGPGQHPSFTTKNIWFSSQDSCFYFNYNGNAKIDKFDVKGNYKGFIDYSGAQDEYKGQEIGRSTFFQDSIWIIHAINRKGNDLVRLLFFNQNGQYITKIANNDFWEGVNRQTIKKGATGEIYVDFYQNNKHQLFFREERGDTIYEITSDLQMKPHIVFSFRDGYTYADRRSGAIKNYIYQFIKETDDYLIFSYAYRRMPLAVGLYNKKEKQLYRLQDAGPLFNQKQSSGFVDNLSGGINTTGTNPYQRNLTMKNQIINFRAVNILLHQLTPEYLAQVSYRDTLAHQKLVNLMDTLNEEDNPVVIITHLK